LQGQREKIKGAGKGKGSEWRGKAAGRELGWERDQGWEERGRRQKGREAWERRQRSATHTVKTLM